MNHGIFQEKEKEYDLLVEDEQIAFVMAEKMAGSRTEDKEERNLSEMELKKMSMEETRKSLPIYKYRDSLLEAIENHQVLIIEGAGNSSLYSDMCFWELFNLVSSMLLIVIWMAIWFNCGKIHIAVTKVAQK